MSLTTKTILKTANNNVKRAGDQLTEVDANAKVEGDVVLVPLINSCAFLTTTHTAINWGMRTSSLSSSTLVLCNQKGRN